MQADFRIAPFSEHDFEAYEGWFAHPSIARALGDVDRKWLDHVLKDEQGKEFAIRSHDGELLAVVGIAFPTAGHPVYAITNLAVSRLANLTAKVSRARKG